MLRFIGNLFSGNSNPQPADPNLPGNFLNRLETIEYNLDLIPAYFICPISLEIMEHPVMINDDQRLTYDHSQVRKLPLAKDPDTHLELAHKIDPLTRAIITSVKPNPERNYQIDAFVTCLETIHKLKNDITALRDALMRIAQEPETFNVLAEGMNEEQILKLQAEQREEILKAKNTAKFLLLSEYQKFIALTVTAIEAEDKNIDEKLAEIARITIPYKELHDKLALELRRNNFWSKFSSPKVSNPLLPQDPNIGPDGMPLYEPEQAPPLLRRALFFTRRNGMHSALHSVLYPAGVAGITGLFARVPLPPSAEVVLLDNFPQPVEDDDDMPPFRPPLLSSTALVQRASLLSPAAAARLRPPSLDDIDEDAPSIPSAPPRDQLAPAIMAAQMPRLIEDDQLSPPIFTAQLPLHVLAAQLPPAVGVDGVPLPVFAAQLPPADLGQPGNLDGQMPPIDLIQSVNLASDQPVTSLVEDLQEDLREDSPPPLAMLPQPQIAAFMPPTAVVRAAAQYLLLPPPATAANLNLQNVPDGRASPGKKLD